MLLCLYYTRFICFDKISRDSLIYRVHCTLYTYRYYASMLGAVCNNHTKVYYLQ